MSAYQLSQQDHDRIFEDIVQRQLGQSQAMEQPLAVVTGGQPGAGKSGLADQLKARLRTLGGYVLIDADKLRARHPHYARALREDDKNAADLVHPDAGQWAGKLQRAAAQARRNLIIDQTSRDPRAFAELAATLRANGYRVEAHFMATHPLVSAQRITTRYESQKAGAGTGRYSNKDKHDAAFAGLAQTIAAVEEQALADSLTLYDSTHQPIYTNTLLPQEFVQAQGQELNEGLEEGQAQESDLEMPQELAQQQPEPAQEEERAKEVEQAASSAKALWQSPPAAAEVFARQVQGPLPAEAAQDVARAYAQAAQRMRQRAAPQEEIARIEALAQVVDE